MKGSELQRTGTEITGLKRVQKRVWNRMKLILRGVLLKVENVKLKYWASTQILNKKIASFSSKERKIVASYRTVTLDSWDGKITFFTHPNYGQEVIEHSKPCVFSFFFLCYYGKVCAWALWCFVHVLLRGFKKKKREGGRKDTICIPACLNTDATD